MNLLQTDFLVLTYDDIWSLTNKLAKKIRKEKLEPDILLGITRGGLVVTRILSDIMNNFNVVIIGVGFYKGLNETEKEPILTQELTMDLSGQEVLLIDDVSDTGRSFEFVVKYLQKMKLQTLKTAALHFKPHSIFKPDYFITETSKWIVYPWEYMEFTRLYFKQQLEKNKDKKAIIQELKNIKIPEVVLKEVFEF